MTTLIRTADEGAESEARDAGTRPAGRRPGLWLWPALATLAIAAYSVDRPLLGTDELVTSDVANRSVSQVFGLLHNVDAVHATYYLLMHGWIQIFGDSHTALRMPSVLAMSATAGLVALIGRRLFDRRAGMCAGLLFALIPAVSRFGQEARGYALVVLAATAATLLLLRALDKPRSRPRWAAYALSLAFTGLLHLIALTVLAGHLAAVAVRARRERGVLWRWCVASLAGVVCVAPVIVMGTSHADRQIFWIPEPDAWGLLHIWQQVFASALCAGAVIMSAVTAATAWKARRDSLVLCVTVALFPPLLLWAASHGDISYFRFHYLLFIVPAWALLAGAGLAAVTRSWLPAGVCLLVLAVLVLPDQRRMRGTYEHDVPHNADYAGAARTISEHYRPGDGALYVRGAPWMLDQGVRYYLPSDVRPREVFVTRTAAENNELYPLHCPDPAACLKGERRIWVVVPGQVADPLDSVPGNEATALRARYTTSGTRRLDGLTVALLELKKS